MMMMMIILQLLVTTTGYSGLQLLLLFLFLVTDAGKAMMTVTQAVAMLLSSVGAPVPFYAFPASERSEGHSCAPVPAA
jgi:hypothetical protein